MILSIVEFNIVVIKVWNYSDIGLLDVFMFDEKFKMKTSWIVEEHNVSSSIFSFAIQIQIDDIIEIYFIEMMEQ